MVRLKEQGHIKKDRVTIVIAQIGVVLLQEKVRRTIAPGVITGLLLLPDHILQVPEAGHPVTGEVRQA